MFNLIIGLKVIWRNLTSDLNNILSFFDKFSYNIFVHVYLLNRFDNKYKSQDKKIDINIKEISKKKSNCDINSIKKFY